MFCSTIEPKRLYLVAALRVPEVLSSKTMPQPGSGHFESRLHRFPPIEDVVAALDHIASHTIAA